MMMFHRFKKVVLFFGLLVSCAAFSGTVALNMSGLEDLGANARYEGWLVVNGSPVSTGVFSVDSLGDLSQTVFNVSDSDADDASVFILTIEPFPDLDPNPADSHLLAGDVIGGLADVSVGHPAAIGDDFTASSGGFALINPTGDKGSSFENGIWFVVPVPPPETVGLNLPTLPAGWVYEGWVVDNSLDQPISTGTFSDENGPDSDGAGAAAGLGPALLFPGQDFINPARDLSENHTAVISIEPVPDNSPAPFTLKPLLVPIVDNFGSQAMNNNAVATNPFGQVSVNGSGPGPGSVQSVPTLGFWGMLLLCLLAMAIVHSKFNTTKID
ncbi:hypothetical protein MNBD_GAMMA02-1848 [hydrothermal vent metagenome]|uniref:Uncharacterized protein n=1 Tax=hydrothermal vent metagenome TaxID=652676 RepID=A0A3B0W2P4_9ZZZZ